jgi:putative flippase GtrA
MPRFPRELFVYGLASACAFAVDISLLLALTRYAGMHYLLAAAIAFLAGGVAAWLLSVRFVFRHRRVAVPAYEATAFVLLGLAGLVVNMAVLALLVGRAGLDLLSSKVCAAGCTFFVNYGLRKYLLFTPRRPDEPTAAP